jgi:CRISPR-associated protein Cas5d
VLINACYRLYAEIKTARYNRQLSEKALQQKKRGFNDRHACQEIFNRRLNQGQCHDIPFLGWREFTPDYFGPFREKNKVEESINLTLPSFLYSVFEPSGRRNPEYKQDKRIEKGGLEYA